MVIPWFPLEFMAIVIKWKEHKAYFASCCKGKWRRLHLPYISIRKEKPLSCSGWVIEDLEDLDLGRRGVGCRNPRIEKNPSLLGSFESPTSFNLDYRLIRDGGLQAETIFLFSVVMSNRNSEGSSAWSLFRPNIILLNMHSNCRWKLFHPKTLLNIWYT